MSNMEGVITLEDARIIFRNFAGKEGKYNREGDRNFCVLLDEDLARELDRDGWNVKALRAREEGDPDQPYIQVSVSFKGRPPRIVMITSRGRTDLPEEMIETLDWVDIKTVDLMINPYAWDIGGRQGISAYLRSMYITIIEDALELKYSDVEYLPSRSGRVEE